MAIVSCLVRPDKAFRISSIYVPASTQQQLADNRPHSTRYRKGRRGEGYYYIAHVHATVAYNKGLILAAICYQLAVDAVAAEEMLPDLSSLFLYPLTLHVLSQILSSLPSSNIHSILPL